MTKTALLDSLYGEIQNSMFEAVSKAGTGRNGLFSTAYTQMQRIIEAKDPSEYIKWPLVSQKASDFLKWDDSTECYWAVLGFLEESSLSDQTVSRFDDLLFYFSLPNREAFEAVRDHENVRVSDLVPKVKGSNATNVSLKRLRLLDEGYSAAHLDIAGTVLATAYTQTELKTLITTASLRGIPMDRIKSIHKVRTNCTVQQLISAAEHFDSAVEVINFANTIPISRRVKEIGRASCRERVSRLV